MYKFWKTDYFLKVWYVVGNLAQEFCGVTFVELEGNFKLLFCDRGFEAEFCGRSGFVVDFWRLVRGSEGFVEKVDF